MAISFQSNGGYTQGTSPLAVTAPAGTAVGDLLVMGAAIMTTVSQGTITTPTGWTLVGSSGAASDGGTPAFTNSYCFYRVADASDVGASSYSVAYNTGGTFTNLAANIRDYSGTDTVSPINASAFVLTTASSFTNIVPALTETFVPGEWYVACSNSDINVDVTTTSPTLSNTYDPSPFFVLFYMGDYIPGSSPGTETFTYTGSSPARTGWGVSIKPLASAGSILLMAQACL